MIALQHSRTSALDALAERRAEGARTASRLMAGMALAFLALELVLGSIPTDAIVLTCLVLGVGVVGNYLASPRCYRRVNRLTTLVTQGGLLYCATYYPHVGLAALTLPALVHTLNIEPSARWRAVSLVTCAWAAGWSIAAHGTVLTEGFDPADLPLVYWTHCVVGAVLTALLLGVHRRFNHELLHETRARGEALAREVDAQRAATVTLAERRRSLEAVREGVARSLTTEAQHQHRLAAAHEQLEQFAYAASHDLKEPIRTIRSFVQVTQRQLPPALAADASLGEHFGFISASADAMHAVLEKLLLYSRVGGAGEARGVYSVADLWAGALAAAGAQADLAGVSVATEIPTGLTVALPATHARLLFAELLTNALTFHDGTRAPAVSCVAEHIPGERVRIRIADNGIGIDEAYHEQVFGLFKRLHAREVYAGSGLGLALVRRVTDGAGGEIRLRSTVGEGTVAELVLPGAAHL